MLNQILQEIEGARGSITINELSRKLGVEPNVLEGMIQFWVQKGRLQSDDDQISDMNCTCGTGTSSCAPVSDCVFIAKMPKSYSIQER